MDSAGGFDLAAAASGARWTAQVARGVLGALEKSGLPRAEFAAQHGIHEQRLYNWQRRLAERDGSAPVQFRELASPVAAVDDRLEVVLPSGVLLRVPASFDAAALDRLLGALGPRPLAMLSLPPSVRIFVATQPVDGRKGVDSLVAIVRCALLQDPLSGHLYVFLLEALQPRARRVLGSQRLRVLGQAAREGALSRSLVGGWSARRASAGSCRARAAARRHRPSGCPPSATLGTDAACRCVVALEKNALC